MIKKLQTLCIGLMLSINTFALTHNISVDAVGSPAKAAFSQTEVIVAPKDTAKLTNNTSVTIFLSIDGVPFNLPLQAGSSFAYEAPAAGYGSITVKLSTLSSTLPSNGVPLVLKEPTVVTPKDSDNDGIPDFAEIIAGTKPDNADSDEDGVNDGVEVGILNFDADTSTRTNPLIKDTDEGGLTDGQEDLNGNGKVDANETDPLNPTDDVITSVNNGMIGQNGLELYPQPATTEVYVNGTGSYTIVDQMGKLVLSGTVEGSKINLQTLQAGLYQLQLNGKTQKLAVK